MTGRVLVTGGAGYIGSHACKALARAGYTPVVYDNLSIGNRWAVRWGPLELGDILDSDRVSEVFETHRPMAVMHFAAFGMVGESMRDPAKYYRNNVIGAVNLIDACRSFDVPRFIFSSTCAVYGIPDALPITEHTATIPINPYGASKLMVERVLADYGMAYGIRHASLRYFNAAGADPDAEIGESRSFETHLIPLAFDAILGRRPPVVVMGTDFPTPDGTAIRDYVHVSDIAHAHVAALEWLGHGSSISLNLSTGHGRSVREVLACIERITGAAVPQRVGPKRRGDPPALVGVSSAALELGLDLRYSASLETIVETAWRWHRSAECPRPHAPRGSIYTPPASAAVA